MSNVRLCHEYNISVNKHYLYYVAGYINSNYDRLHILIGGLRNVNIFYGLSE